MKVDIPSEVEMKLEMARQCAFSIERLKGYENVFSQMSIDYTHITIPTSIRKNLKNWIESQIIIEKSNIHSYGTK